MLPELGLARLGLSFCSLAIIGGLKRSQATGLAAPIQGQVAQFMASWPLIAEKGRQYFRVDSDNTHCIFDITTLSTIHNQLNELQFCFIVS